MRADPRALASATVRTPGTCGELVQGTRAGVAFHVTCPIDLYSTVTVQLPMAAGRVVPADTRRPARAVARRSGTSASRSARA